MRDARRFALGFLHLSHSDFELLTPGEYYDFVDAWQEAEKYRRQETAWMICWIANTCGQMKRPLTPKALLGEEAGPRRIRTAEEKAREMEYLQERFGGISQ